MTTPECIAFEGLAGDWSYEVVGFRCPEQGEYYLLEKHSTLAKLAPHRMAHAFIVVRPLKVRK